MTYTHYSAKVQSGAHVILLYKKLLRTSDHFGQKTTFDPIFEYHTYEKKIWSSRVAQKAKNRHYVYAKFFETSKPLRQP